jgi:hypothetical protein
MNWRDKLKTAEDSVGSSGITASFFNFFQGRATTFAIVFTVVGIILAFRGKLDGNYSLFVAAVQGLVFAHSCKEDWMSRQRQTTTTVVNDINVSSASPADTQTKVVKDDHSTTPSAVIP